MSTAMAAAIKAALLALTDENARKKIGWVLVAIFSPVILLIALLCSLASGGAEHNISVLPGSDRNVAGELSTRTADRAGTPDVTERSRPSGRLLSFPPLLPLCPPVLPLWGRGWHPYPIKAMRAAEKGRAA